MIRLLSSASVNNWRVTLANSESAVSTIVGLTSNVSMNPAQLTAPGVLVVDRVDSNEAATPAKREYISFGSISGQTLYDVTRQLAGSTAQTHGSGSWIEDIHSVTHWGDLIDFVNVDHASDGTHHVLSHVRQITFTGVSGASGIRGDVVIVPGSNISIYASSGASGYNWINVSGPTVAGVGGIPLFTVAGQLAAGTNVTPYNLIEDSTTIKSISAVVKSPVSSASLVLDINNNLTTVFTDQNTRLSILGGGTYASTASIAVPALTPGQLLSLDVDNAGGADLSVLVET